MASDQCPLELWGGVECTVNRVGDRYHDQLERNGHLTRPSDIDRFAALGLRTLRVPLLWELCEKRPGEFSFEAFEPMLERVRERGVTAIAGLVHHGSGPMRTNLLDPGFEHGLAEFAAAVSERFPWLEHYTPVNEPLTTARFSALYGHWYPHACTPPAFVRALLHETRATRGAMAAIRKSVPHARLVQTEDIGSVASTPLLAYQAEHENERRWLSLDLLCGRVDAHHPLYRYLLDCCEVSEEELVSLVSDPCVPDLLGINYYFTSDRLLDERLSLYPAWSHGGNGRHAYADVHRALGPGKAVRGHRQVLQEVWERYRLPLAFTEVHAGATREEQLRWLNEAWQAAKGAREAGVDVRAVTVWSLLGSFDWDGLVTAERGHYESGVFDVRAQEPRPTALATMVRELAHDGDCPHPVLAGLGWWHRGGEPFTTRCGPPRPLAILGRGTLGRALVEACVRRGLEYVWLDRSRLDLTRAESVDAALDAVQPWAVVNAAGYVRVDDAESDQERCFAVNATGPLLLARACKRLGARLLTFSTDLVFDGRSDRPYVESDATSPLCAYGASKVEAERLVSCALESSLIVRTSAFFGPEDAHNFVTKSLELIASGERMRAAADLYVSPTYVPHLVDASLDLLVDAASGIWHLANAGGLTWYELARRAALGIGLPEDRVVPCAASELGFVARRPRYSVLGSDRGWVMPSLDEALARYLELRGPQISAAPRA
jgi:dTDP-4-dehydrorhamnose reductase